MSRMTPVEMAQVLGSGLLSFPVTHFNDDYSVNEAAYRDNLSRLAITRSQACSQRAAPANSSR